MALPTVPSYWTTRRNIYEQAIVKQRNHDSDFRNKWTTHANYFQRSNIAATKKQSWESDKSFVDRYLHVYRHNCECDDDQTSIATYINHCIISNHFYL